MDSEKSVFGGALKPTWPSLLLFTIMLLISYQISTIAAPPRSAGPPGHRYDSCRRRGGAQLDVQEGRWLTGSFNLTSNFTLFLHRGAVILASQQKFCWMIWKEPEKEKLKQEQTPQPSTPSKATTTLKPPKKPVYSLKKGKIVRVEKEKYLNSVNYLSVGYPPYYKGLDNIYEDRGEVLDLCIFETGECALIAWVGVPTTPAWLPTEMLIKSEKLDYETVMQADRQGRLQMQERIAMTQ